MPRLLFRSSFQLVLLVGFVFTLLYYIDSRYRVLPSSIHNHLPAHHPGFVITDITVNSCRIGNCQLGGKWTSVEKDLYLKAGWMTKAYVHVQRKKEEELTAD